MGSGHAVTRADSMVWTTAGIKAAYRLTATDELIAAALNDAEWRVHRYLGEHAITLDCRWEMPIWEFGQYALGLPRLTESVSAVSSTAEPGGIGDAYLSDAGWTLRRRRPLGFWGTGHVQATLHLVDDRAARDGIIAAMALDYIGLPMPEGQQRSWRRLLDDWRGPQPPYRLPDIISVGSGSPPPPASVSDLIYIGVLPAADTPIDLSELTGMTAGLGRSSLVIPAFTGRQFVYVASRSDRPLASLTVGAGGIDILPTFTRRRIVDTVAGDTYDAWVSGQGYQGRIASGQTVTVSR